MAFQLYIVDMHDLNMVCQNYFYLCSIDWNITIIACIFMHRISTFYAHFDISIGLIYAICTKAFLLVNE